MKNKMLCHFLHSKEKFPEIVAVSYFFLKYILSIYNCILRFLFDLIGLSVYKHTILNIYLLKKHDGFRNVSFFFDL